MECSYICRTTSCNPINIKLFNKLQTAVISEGVAIDFMELSTSVISESLPETKINVTKKN